MKKLLFGIFLLSVIVVAVPTMVRADINVSISLPPPILFVAPPALIVLPETDVYVVPDDDVEIFFYDGWWWRPWEGRWYRSHYYNSGWGYYRSVPSFYGEIPSGWRNDYRDRRWRGHQWNYEKIPHQQVRQNWRGWKKNRHWEKQNNWGVQGLKPRAHSQSKQPSHDFQSQTKAQEKPQSREALRPQQSQPKVQTVEPQNRKAGKPQKYESRKEKPERGDENKKLKKKYEKK